MRRIWTPSGGDAFQRVRWVGVVLLFGVIAVVMTYPLAGRMTSALPENLGDPLLNSWIIGWGSQRLLAGLQGFWQAERSKRQRRRTTFQLLLWPATRLSLMKVL